MWQTAFGKIIARYATCLQVHENIFYRWITYNSDIIQTLLYKRNPAKPTLRYHTMLTYNARQRPGNTALLGLGGGAIAHQLCNTNFTGKLTIIEKQAEIISIAKKYFFLDRIKNKITLQHMDANNWVTSAITEKFDHILVDLADATHIPPKICNTQFFTDCKQKLTQQGIISINLNNTQDNINLIQAIHHLFNGATSILPVKSSNNHIMIAYNNPEEQNCAI